MREQERKQQIFDLLNAEIKASISTVYKANHFILQKNNFLRKREEEDWTKKTKRLFNCSHSGD